MSFIFGLLAGAGEIVAGSAVEATGSTLVGDIAGSTVAGTIGSQITNIADSAMSTVVDTLWGKNAYEDKKKQFYNSIDEAKALNLFTGDISGEKEVLQHIRDSNYSKNDLINTIHNFAHDFTDEVVKKGADIAVPLSDNSTMGDIMAKLSQTNSVYYYLVNKMLEKSNEIVIPTNDPEYQAIAAVYNGKGQYSSLCKQTYDGKNMIFTEINELGELDIWKYPEFQTYTVVPSIYGVYTGINSRNNEVPLRGIVNNKVVDSFLDGAAFRHDCSYRVNGSFNKTADYQLISRISQNMDKLVFPGEKLYANVAVNYFSFLGALMRRMMGPDEEKTPIVKELFGEIYNIDVASDELQNFIEHKRVPSGDTNTQLVNLINNLQFEMD